MGNITDMILGKNGTGDNIFQPHTWFGGETTTNTRSRPVVPENVQALLDSTTERFQAMQDEGWRRFMGGAAPGGGTPPPADDGLHHVDGVGGFAIPRPGSGDTRAGDGPVRPDDKPFDPIGRRRDPVTGKPVLPERQNPRQPGAGGGGYDSPGDKAATLASLLGVGTGQTQPGLGAEAKTGGGKAGMDPRRLLTLAALLQRPSTARRS